MADPHEVPDMQFDWFLKSQNQPRYMIVQRGPDDFEVALHSEGNVFPSTSYPTAEQALARLAQLMGVKHPIKPQDWPEDIQIGGNDDQAG